MQVKVAELVAESTRSWQDAVETAIAQASKDYRNISGVEVCNWTANCKDDKITEYKANISIAYVE